MSRRCSLIGWVVFFFALLWLVTPFVGKVHAAFPEKPLTIIVPFSAGGGVDGLARALASRLEKELGVPVVVKNEGGSGGRKGSITLFKSPTDGYTHRTGDRASHGADQFDT